MIKSVTFLVTLISKMRDGLVETKVMLQAYDSQHLSEQR